MNGSVEARKVQLCLSTVSVRIEDVSSVREAIRLCDRGRLLSCILWEWAGWHADADLMPGRARAALRRKLRSLIALMLDAGPGCNPDGKIIVPFQAFHVIDVRGVFRRSVGAAVSDLTRMRPAEDMIAAAGGRARSLAEMRDIEEMFGGVDPVQVISLMGSLRDASCLAGSPWPDVLDMPLWLPADMSMGERHMVLGHIVWAMVQEGFASIFDATAYAAECLGGPLGYVPDATECDSLRRFVNLLNYDSWLDSFEAARDIAHAL